MTKKIFWENPYQTSHDTTVTVIDGADIMVYSTIFFAFSGGQESDQGTIGGHPVLAAMKDGLEIVYTLPENHGLVLGDSVRMEIDWTRRYRLMRLHFAAELVLELFYKKLNGVDKVGAHIAQEKARIDFAWPESISPLLPILTAEANQIIEADLAITSAFEDESNERRYWEIEGFSRVPCGGTHVRRTSEIGPIKLKRNNIGRGKERVEIYLSS
ncbi:MAG TPA: alanyl-tRNA editing protein [Burkholderiaceae bacterium]|jgi:Ser-tRNA(Ala) deacylase AlaX|nr:alanyl-tRNA editing protein [Burkholderiaceae bacterium]